MMNTLRIQFHFNHSHLRKSAINVVPQIIIPTTAKSKLTSPFPAPSKSSHVVNSKTTIHVERSPISKNTLSGGESPLITSSKDHSRIVILGAASLGIALFLMGFGDDQKALAFGPEGPLMEDFWDNMRRYALYALTVSTGALYVLLEPIIELLKNPISAVLIIVIIGGGFFLVSQVVTAMVGLSDFSYDYNY